MAPSLREKAVSDIILWRHADAEFGEPDMERKLTRKGKKQAAKMGAWLEQQLPENCKILCSPAQRALQTVEGLGRKYKICNALAPDASVEAMLDACQSEQGKILLVVGHQPTLGQLASLLLTGNVQDWTLRKGSILWIAQRKHEEGEDAPRYYIKAALPAELTDS
jgi:phosphohistidine phosphatase